MFRSRLLELASTKFLVHTAVGSLLVTVGIFSAILYLKLADLEHVSKFADAVFKTGALLVGALWALNRYYVQRTDETQFRVDSDVSMVQVPGSQDHNLLIFRLDLVNTGKTQIGQYMQFVEVHTVGLTQGVVKLEPLFRWPDAGWHPAGSIEPGSWGAINIETGCPSATTAIRLFLAVALSEEKQWTWHKTFALSGGESPK
jgi:hypothetical protein